MKYFTAGEARSIVSGTRLELCTGYGDNPNREALEACVSFASEVGSSNWGYVSFGFVLGYATGVRAERARRAGMQAKSGI
ncbi:MAG TPA: hypothetical protein VN446_08650 [Candidatus Acidoferrum sp.]|nr:hypothetical protein [Candidatus Acidoferrum sp.]